MTVLEEGARSRLHITERGGLEREYTDTGARCRVPIRVDAAGRVRVSGNRTLDSLLENAVGREERAMFRGGEHGRRDGVVKRETIPPAHIQSAHQCLLSLPRQRDGKMTDISSLSSMCGVKESTAWSYLFKTVETYPSSNVHAVRFLYPLLLPALLQVDQRGSLLDVLRRLNEGPLSGDMEWRCVRDRCAHIRLARLCLTERG